MVEKQQIKSGIQDGGLLGSKVRVTPLRKYEVKSDQTRQKAIELQNTRPGASRDSNTATTNHPNASVQATKHTEVDSDSIVTSSAILTTSHQIVDEHLATVSSVENK